MQRQVYGLITNQMNFKYIANPHPIRDEQNDLLENFMKQKNNLIMDKNYIYYLKINKGDGVYEERC